MWRIYKNVARSRKFWKAANDFSGCVWARGPIIWLISIYLSFCLFIFFSESFSMGIFLYIFFVCHYSHCVDFFHCRCGNRWQTNAASDANYFLVEYTVHTLKPTQSRKCSSTSMPPYQRSTYLVGSPNTYDERNEKRKMRKNEKRAITNHIYGKYANAHTIKNISK